MMCKLCRREFDGDPVEGEYCSQDCYEYSDVAERVCFDMPDRKYEGRYIGRLNGKIVFPKFPVMEPSSHVVTLEDKGRYMFAFLCDDIENKE